MTRSIPLPPLERLEELFTLDVTRGILTNKTNRPRSPVGAVVGTPNNHGHLICRVDYKIYYVHRIIFKMHHGIDPDHKVDHQDRDRKENSINNLRSVSDAQNMWNMGVKRKTKSGLKGAHWSSSEEKWRSSIVVNKNSVHLGWFETKEEAHAAYVKASLAMHGEFSIFNGEKEKCA